jgi:NitT/TauT family transport system substrate-binding protein
MAQLTRRAALAATTAALGLPRIARAQARVPVSFRLNWYLGGLHAPYYLGRERGLYAEEGIELTINEGRGSANTAQAVAARSDTFGLADSGSLMNLAARGAPIRAVMSVLNTASFGVISPASAPIRTAADMRGRRLAAGPGGAPALLLPAVLAANNMRREDVTIVSVDPAAVPITLMEGRADGLLGGVDDQPFLMAQRGFRTHSVTYAELGVNTVGMAVLAHEEAIRGNPDLVRRFVRASARSWEAAGREPEAAVAAALRVKPDLDRESTLGQLRVDLGLQHSDATRGRPTGWAALSDWERSLRIMRDFRELRTDRDAASFFTNDFLPGGGTA